MSGPYCLLPAAPTRVGKRRGLAKQDMEVEIVVPSEEIWFVASFLPAPLGVAGTGAN